MDAATFLHFVDFDALQGDLIQISKSAFGMDVNTVSSLATITSSGQLTSALATSNTFIYDNTNGNLYWNQNGSAAGAGIGGIFAVLDNKAAITASTLSLIW